MIKDKLQCILENHKHWLKEDCDGWESMKAELRGVDLRGANLRRADLRKADLQETDLRRADLWGADLRGANLRGANLQGADLRRADFHDADIRNAHGIWYPLACPCEGEFIAWKKARCQGKKNRVCIVKLLIPADAKRLSATTEKCRADKALVLEIYDMNGHFLNESAFSSYYNAPNFEYKKGEMVYPEKPFDENRWNECSSGIHFFIDREMALRY